MPKTKIDHAICPICNRKRAHVARLFQGVQVAIGKRTTCVECGVAVLERMDAKHNTPFSKSSVLADSMRVERSKKIRELNREIHEKKLLLVDLSMKIHSKKKALVQSPSLLDWICGKLGYVRA